MVQGALWLLTAGLLLHLACGALGHGDTTFALWLLNSIELLATGLLALRVATRRRDRLAWGLLTGYVAMSTAGDLAWTFLQAGGQLAPGSAADVFYYAAYPLAYAGVVLLLRQGARSFTPAMWLDGLAGGLALASVAAAVVLTPKLAATSEVALTVGYVVGDLLLLCFVGLAAGLSGWRPGRAWLLIGVALSATAIVDATYAYQETTGVYTAEAVLSTLWPAGLVAMACAGWQPPRTIERRDETAVSVGLMPAIFAGIALLVLGIDHWHPASDTGVLLALGALVAAALRGAITYRENLELLDRSRREALTDALTGLGNRRRLMTDIDAAMAEARAGRPRTLAFFDLDGFKGYNDAFGHNAGDALLHRIGAALAAAVAAASAAYRLGGDEFCVLLDGALDADAPRLQAAVAALRERGEGFTIGASFGLVSLPGDADTAMLALQLADERMYAQKGSRRTSARRQTRDILVQVLGEREPGLRIHMDHVAAHAAATARQLGLAGEAVDEVARAAELHDIGKVAVPDSVLRKPGELDADEWRLMRQHPMIGERILLAAPALRPVAALVRASHERWDGGGYPDGLAGAAIPLGARIVAVCDAYDAMVSDRPYRAGMAPAAALAELRRCGGTQFDPQVVAAFVAVMTRASAATPARPIPPALGGQQAATVG